MSSLCLKISSWFHLKSLQKEVVIRLLSDSGSDIKISSNSSYVFPACLDLVQSWVFSGGGTQSDFL